MLLFKLKLQMEYALLPATGSVGGGISVSMTDLAPVLSAVTCSRNMRDGFTPLRTYALSVPTFCSMNDQHTATSMRAESGFGAKRQEL